MSIDGLRAWIGEVERKLKMRTRVFLVLAVLAFGAAGAAIYLAVDTRDDAVSESDVRALQEELEVRVQRAEASAAGATPTDVSSLESQVRALQQEVKGLSGKGPGGPSGKQP